MLSGEASFGGPAAELIARPLSRLAALAATLALGLGGCGSGDRTPGFATGTVGTELTLALDADGPGGQAVRVAGVSCPGSDAAACRAVDSLPDDPAAPVPTGTACTEIFGGPETLEVEGTLRGEPVRGVLNRSNGCEIARFDRFADLLSVVFAGYRPGASLSP